MSRDNVTQSDMWCPKGRKVDHLYAQVCHDYGIHFVASKVAPLRADEKLSRATVKRTGTSWCGPHKIVRLNTR